MFTYLVPGIFISLNSLGYIKFQHNNIHALRFQASPGYRSAQFVMSKSNNPFFRWFNHRMCLAAPDGAEETVKTHTDQKLTVSFGYRLHSRDPKSVRPQPGN